MFESLGNHTVERKGLHACVLELERGRWDDDLIAHRLRHLARTNWMPRLYDEGAQQSKEPLEMYERLGNAEGQAKCWNYLGWFFSVDFIALPVISINPRAREGRPLNIWRRPSDFRLIYLWQGRFAMKANWIIRNFTSTWQAQIWC